MSFWQLVTGRNRSNSSDDEESFWVLDIKRNSAARIGHVYQLQHAGSEFEPSPDFRRGFNKPTGSFNEPEFYICDLDAETLRKERVDGWPCGWWDTNRILFKTTNNDLALFDIAAEKMSPFLTLRQLRTAFSAFGLTNDPGQANSFFMWNGRENEFYLNDGNKRWSAAESYLLKIERPDGAIKLLDPRFKFEWSDHFDMARDYYLYSGRESGKSNGAVFLRDLKTHQTHELVPSDTNNSNRFSIPMFYGKDLIYMRSNALWRIQTDGSNNHQIFPPPENAR